MLCNELTLTGSDYDILDIDFSDNTIQILDTNTKYLYNGNFIDFHVDATNNIVSNMIGDVLSSSYYKYDFFIKLYNFSITVLEK